MTNIYVALVIIVAFLSCQNSFKGKSIKTVSQKRHEATFRDCALVDTSISGIELMNEPSVLDKFGNLKQYIRETKEGEVVFILNSANTEQLTLFTLPGAGYNDFYAVRVQKNLTLFSSEFGKFELNHFMTEDSVHLGMHRLNFEAIKGITTNTMDTVKIDISDSDLCMVIDRFDMPSYSAKYIFSNDSLSFFEFGFNVP